MERGGRGGTGVGEEIAQGAAADTDTGAGAGAGAEKIDADGAPTASADAAPLGSVGRQETAAEDCGLRGKKVGARCTRRRTPRHNVRDGRSLGTKNNASAAAATAAAAAAAASAAAAAEFDAVARSCTSSCVDQLARVIEVANRALSGSCWWRQGAPFTAASCGTERVDLACLPRGRTAEYTALAAATAAAAANIHR